MKSLDQLAAETLRRPENQLAITFEGQNYAWGQLRAIAESCLGQLAQAGITPGARVALIAHNHPAAIAALLGLLSKTYELRMIYPFMSSAALAKEITASGVDTVVAPSAVFDDTLMACLQTENKLGLAYQTDRTTLMYRPDPSVTPRREMKSSQATITILTSGTTGTPKPFSIRYQTLAADVDPNLRPRSMDEENGIPMLLYFPVGNISGLYSTLPAIFSGRPVLLLARFSLSAGHQYIKQYRPVVSGLPPAAISTVLTERLPVEDLSSLKALGAGAAPLPIEVQRDFEARYDIPILLSYGATEFAGPVTRTRLEDRQTYPDGKLGSVGRAMPGVKLRIIDSDTGQTLPANREGILEVIAPRIGDEWIRTSDIASLDEDGFLYIHGRADGAIMRGGFKILPETIESALIKHPAINAAAVVGLRDKRLGEVPAAAVEISHQHPAPSPEDLEIWLRQSLLATHIPVAWRRVKQLPRTALSFKVDRGAVKQLFEEQELNPNNTAPESARRSKNTDNNLEKRDVCHTTAQ